MKIAYLIGEFPSLSETFILNQIVGLILLGHEVDIYAQRPKNTPKIHQDILDNKLLSKTFYRPRIPKNYLIRLFKTFFLVAAISFRERSFASVRLLNSNLSANQVFPFVLFYFSIPFFGKKKTYDVVHCHFGHVGIIGSQLREMGVFQGRICTTFHGWDMTEFLKISDAPIYKHLFDKGDLFLPISRHWNNRLIDLGCHEQKMQVHHMGIDCKKFIYTPREKCIERPVNIITIARLVEKKGIEYALRAIKIAHQYQLSFRYQIIGNGPLKNELKALSADLGISHRVEFLGGQSQERILEILHTSDFMVAPSVTSRSGDQEGIPVVLMEAMATGLPIVSTVHTGIPELVEDGVSGFLVSERNVKALADKIMYLINNPQKWSSLGLAGRQEVEKYYDINSLNKQLEDKFLNLL